MTDPARPPALDCLMAELDETMDRIAEAEDALARARARRADLTAAIAPMLRGLAPGERERAERRLAEMETPAGGEGAALGRTRLTKAALGFLAEAESPEIRAAELTWYLRRMGFDPVPQYAGTLLRAWSARGVVARTGHGVYRVNRCHPEILRLRMARVERMAGTP